MESHVHIQLNRMMSQISEHESVADEGYHFGSKEYAALCQGSPVTQDINNDLERHLETNAPLYTIELQWIELQSDNKWTYG